MSAKNLVNMKTPGTEHAVRPNFEITKVYRVRETNPTQWA